MTTIWFRRAIRVALAVSPLLPFAALAQEAGMPKYGSLGLDTGNMNRDVVPGDDFYSYMEGN